MADNKVSQSHPNSTVRAAAAAEGVATYTPIIPCARGHFIRNTLSNACVLCMRQTSSAWKKKHRKENPELTKERAAAIYIKNAVAMRKYQAERRKTQDPEERRLAGIEWRKKNPGYAAKAAKEWRVKNGDYGRAQHRAWSSENPELTRLHNATRRAKLAGALGTHTAAEIAAKLKKQGGKCYYCFIKLKGKQHVDHYIALINGGHNDIANLNISCVACNSQKNASHPLDFVRRKFNRLV